MAKMLKFKDSMRSVHFLNITDVSLMSILERINNDGCIDYLLEIWPRGCDRPLAFPFQKKHEAMTVVDEFFRELDKEVFLHENENSKEEEKK